MRKSFNITEQDIRTIINEVCRKLSLLNESMEEGGAAGHMTHPYEVDEFTFGDYKQLVRDLYETKIERYSEKLDGMNIFITVSPDGVPRFARNKSHIKSPEGGMDPQGIAEKWGQEGRDPSTLAAYENAYKLFTDVMEKIPNPVEFFNGEGYKIYANCEVIDSRHPNVIPYPETALSFHGLVAYANDGTGNEIELPDEIFDEKMAVLERLMPDVKSQYGKAQITPEVVIKIRENNQEKIDYFTTYIDDIEEYAGVNDNTTIIQYREKQLPIWMQNHGFEMLLGNPFTELFLKRWVYGTKAIPYNITQLKKQMAGSGIPNWEEVFNMARTFEGNPKPTAKDPLNIALKEIMVPIETFFYRLGNDIISNCVVYTNMGRETETVNVMIKQLKATQELIAQTGDLESEKEMTYWLQRLSELDFKYNSLEGVVFQYKGHTFKLTGSFAALNRAVNIRMKIAQKQENQA